MRLGLTSHERNAAEDSGRVIVSDLSEEGRGEALDAGAKDAKSLMAKSALESPTLAEPLMEEVCNRENLESAWKRFRSSQLRAG